MQGVYKIENINNGKKYIGSSKDIEKRFYQHKQELKKKTHHSVKLQHDKGQDFAKYDYFNGKVILDKEGTDSIIKYLDSKSMYDKLHHQVRGDIN